MTQSTDSSNQFRSTVKTNPMTESIPLTILGAMTLALRVRYASLTVAWTALVASG